MYTIIVGGGQVGAYLASLLLAEKHQIKIIDNHKERISVLEQTISAEFLVLGSGSDPNVLESRGYTKQMSSLRNGSDETNLVVWQPGALEFRVPRVLARVNNPKNAWLYTPEMGWMSR